MRKVWYRIFWSASDWFPGFRRNSLEYFVLDIPYFIYDENIPSLSKFNKIFAEGGSSGGMSPGTVWKPFQIDEAEYEELVDALKTLNVVAARKRHPFIYDNITKFVTKDD